MGAWHDHGGNVAAARAAFPDAPTPWLDLSTGINPQPWDVSRAGAVYWAALPDVAALEALEAAAGRFFGVAPERVCAVPGTEIGLRLLGTLGLPLPMRYRAPSYGTYGQIGEARPVAERDLEEEASRGGTILIAQPNNPDGAVLSEAGLHDIAGRLEAAGGVLVVDEAFADTQDQPSAAARLGERVIALRSFGKFFGLAGVRLGFVLAAPERLAPLRRQLGSWPVNSAALAIGQAAYGDGAWIGQTRARLRQQADRLDALLRCHGFEPSGACPLFRLVSTSNAETLFQRLAAAGILTRPFAYAPDWLRFGRPGDDAAFERLDRALARG
ncbi:aminotransferase class I/II-fold pyridoxal phosphate-dependent enzyme [Sphingosinicella sp. BN140058]|uniref:aminotransferase class I/II-fold pyridoxal phosphate-dependent enzyme n=1 Tax=Sphingosinicella sp. BN140058 TaxID=1892855 RepID=UPI001010AA2A|nr:aminotransferase class I/II-fold pyridoxal phosphate-dependent enzyme [Sphingosinicella sp. BN140058]QAY77514.1 pyridoxal phosphate-dependent class II aminotransferase [Sphingosinicella sp. BN140058]